MRVKPLLAAFCCAVAAGAVGAGSAFAGEVTGPFPDGTPLWTGTIVVNGEVVGHTLHGKSVCAFSGLNIPSEEPNEPPTRTQSFGQIVRVAGPMGGVPGTACNPTKGAAG